MFEYYLAVGDGIMRALNHRPTTLQRFPEGIDGEAFYQKRVPTRGVPPWINTAKITFPSGRTADELCPVDLAHVAWAAQMGTVVFHPWPVRDADPDKPDELRLDLDPSPGTDFGDAAAAAQVVREVLDDLGAAGWPKTSGGRGVHVYLRIQPRWTFVEVRRATIALAREVARRRPDLVTTSWWKEERGERVFVDFNQMARDRTIACAYSLRANARATASSPVTWDELPDVEPDDFDLRTLPKRFADDRRPARRHRRHPVRPHAAAGVGGARRAGRRGRHALPARPPQDARRTPARAAQPQERRQLGGAGQLVLALRLASLIAG